jgi:hypothetical protein
MVFLWITNTPVTVPRDDVRLRGEAEAEVEPVLESYR